MTEQERKIIQRMIVAASFAGVLPEVIYQFHIESQRDSTIAEAARDAIYEWDVE